MVANPSGLKGMFRRPDGTTYCADLDATCCDTVVVTSCCPGVSLPTTLYATLTTGVAGCSGSVAIVYDAVAGRWKGDMALPLGTLHIEVYCDPAHSTWFLDLTNCQGFSHSSMFGTCIPFVQTGAQIISSGCCAGTQGFASPVVVTP